MKTKTKILKVFAIVAIFLGNSHLMAQNSSLSTQTVCVGDIEPYTLVDPVNGPPAVTSTYQWSTTGGVIVGGISTGDNIDINWTTVGVYTVSVVATDIATGCQDSPIDVEVTVEDLANAPIVPNPPPICLNDLNPTMTASTGGGTGNSVFNWYTNNAGVPGALLSTGISYQDPTLYSIATTYDYWVTEESANGCEGSATMVTVTVTPLPTAPTLVSSPYAACFGDPTNPLMTAVGSGSNFNWYEEDLVTPGTPGAQVATNSNTYTSTEVNISTYTYFVEEVVGSCTSPQTTFTFTIHILPAAPSITPDPIEICEGDVPGNFTANTGGAAGTFTWYSDAALTTVIPGAATCTPTEVLQGTYIYYLTETDLTTTCISPSSQATFEIFELPLQPTVLANPSAIICDGQTNPTFTAAQGTGSTGTGDFTWYDDDPANPSAILLGNGATFTPSQTAVGLYTFWLTESNNITGCEGAALLFTFEIVVLPAAPTLIPNPVEICFGDVNPPFIPTGVSSAGANLIWYDDVALTSQVGTGATFTAPGTVVGNAASVTTYSYWVIDQPGNCVSPALQVDLQINPLPTPGPIWHN
jgi:hypothetical protein